MKLCSKSDKNIRQAISKKIDVLFKYMHVNSHACKFFRFEKLFSHERVLTNPQYSESIDVVKHLMDLFI